MHLMRKYGEKQQDARHLATSRAVVRRCQTCCASRELQLAFISVVLSTSTIDGASVTTLYPLVLLMVDTS